MSESMRRYNVKDDAGELSFLQCPRWLVEKKEIKPDLKYLYMLMYDLQKVSISNQWSDELGQIYIYMGVTKIMDYMNCSNKKAVKMKKELEKLGLIDDVQVGCNKPNRIYVKKPW